MPNLDQHPDIVALRRAGDARRLLLLRLLEALGRSQCCGMFG